MNKICTDIHQSKKLIELGIDVKTADMFWDTLISKKPECHVDNHYLIDERDEYRMPAWSLSALLFLFDDKVGLAKEYESWFAYDNGKSHCTKHHNNPLDAAFEMIVYLKENNKL